MAAKNPQSDPGHAEPEAAERVPRIVFDPESWRAVIPLHDAAKDYPEQSDEELTTLSEAIATNGLRHNITLWAVGQGSWWRSPVPVLDLAARKKIRVSLLDGHNRLAAIERIGDPEKKRDLLNEAFRRACFVSDLDGHQDPDILAASLNLHRRHLSIGVRRNIAARLLKAHPERSDRSIGRAAHLDNKTIAVIRAEEEANEEIPHKPADRKEASGRKARGRKPLQLEATLGTPATAVCDAIEQDRLPEASVTAAELAVPVAPPNTQITQRCSRAERQYRRAAETPTRTTSPAQQRDTPIVGFSTLRHTRLRDTLEDLGRLLRDERVRIVETLSLQKRVVLARGYLAALGMEAEDLRPVE